MKKLTISNTTIHHCPIKLDNNNTFTSEIIVDFDIIISINIKDPICNQYQVTRQ